MKKYIFSFIIVIVLIAALGFSFGLIKFGNAPGDISSPISGKALTVNDIQSDPNAYTGTITINGVMAGTTENDPKLFAIVDTEEVKACQAIQCGTFYLPVKFDGQIPNPGDEINVTGSFTGSGNDLIFNASDIEVLGNLVKGGQ